MLNKEHIKEKNSSHPYLFLIVIHICLLFYIVTVSANEGDIQKGASVVNIVPLVQWCESVPSDPSLHQIKELPESVWKPSPDDSLTLGLVSGSYWLRFKLNIGADSEQEKYVLNFHNASLNSIEYYHQKPSGELLSQRPVGTSYAYTGKSDMDIEGNKFVVDLGEPGRHLFWIKITHDGFLDAPIQLYKMDSYFVYELKEQFNKSIFYGFLLALTIYHLFYYLVMRDTIYLGLLMFVSGAVLLFGSIEGVLFKYIWPQIGGLNDIALRVSIPLISTSIIYLSFKFLKINKIGSQVNTLAWLIYLANFVALLLSLFLPVYIALYLTIALSIVTLVGVKILAVSSFWINRDSISLIFLISLSIFVSCNVIVALSVVGVLPVDINNLYSSLKGVMCIQVLVFAIAIVLRIRVMDSERIKAIDESQAKSDVLAKVSHELRTPLNGILGLSHIMSPLLIDKLTQQYNAMISQSATALLTVINDLLDVSSINAGKFTLNLQVTNIHDLVNGVSKSIFTQIDAVKVKGDVCIDSLVPVMLFTDSDRLRQLLSNLLGNAVKYTEYGSIKVKVSCLSKPNCYRFLIEDTGLGIAQSNQKDIFNPYMQEGKKMGSAFKSTGLGLFIAAQLAKALETKIELNSEKGRGSSFWFDLEMLPAYDAKNDKEAIAHQPLSKNILVAEDNNVNQIIIVKLLENMGHTVTLAEDGAQALAMLQQKSYDLVIMDCDMPVMDGYEAVRRWRAEEPIGANTPIVALTAHAYDGHEQKVKGCGMNGQLLKPIKPKELEEAICRYTS